MVALQERIHLAEQLARRLPEVSRNEWMRWLQLVQRYGLKRALNYAQRLANDPTMRPAIQRANQLIAQAVRERRSELERLTLEELHSVLGLVAWHLSFMTARRPPTVSRGRRDRP